MERISIIGDGGFGWAWALLLAWAGHDVTLYTRKPVEECCYPYRWLLQYPVPRNLHLETLTTIPYIPSGELLFVATPTSALKDVVERFCPLAKGDLPRIITLTKGLYGGVPPCNLIEEILPGVEIAHVTGAAFSEQLAMSAKKNVGMDMIVACDCPSLDIDLGRVLEATTIRPVWTCDVCSVQLAFAMRPIVSFMQGLASGYVSNHEKYGTILHLIQSKMKQEGRSIAQALGAKPEVVNDHRIFSVLDADYDLCRGHGSRNFDEGYAAGQGGQRPNGRSARGVVEAINSIHHVYNYLVNWEPESVDERAKAAVAERFPYFVEAHDYLWGKSLDDCAAVIVARTTETHHC